MAKLSKPRSLALTCPECQKAAPADPAALLSSIAAALNACREAGIQLRIRYGIVQCDEGLVLDLPDGTWVPRTRRYTPFPPPFTSDSADD